MQCRDANGGPGRGRRHRKRALQASRPRSWSVRDAVPSQPVRVETEEFTDFTPPKPAECREHYEKRWFILPMRPRLQVAVIQKEMVTYRETCGLADVENPTSVTRATLF